MPCDKFVYDFPCDFGGIVGGYGLRHLCSHCLRASCDFFYGASGTTRGKSVQRLCGDCTEIVQCQCSCRAVSAASARKSHGTRVGIGLRKVPVRGLCNATYNIYTDYGLTIFFKFVKLLAKPNRKGRGDREFVRKSHSRLLPPQGGLAEAARKGGYGQDTGSADPSQAKCELGIINILLRTRRVLSLHKVYGNSALLVLNGTLLNSINALLVLSRRYIGE